VKAAYGWVIKKVSETAYDEEKPVTVVIVDHTPAASSELAEFKVLPDSPPGLVLAQVPRYQAFTAYSQALACAGVNFVEIAGNRDVILISAIVPADYDTHGLNVLMKQPVMTKPGMQRLLFTVKVGDLAVMLRQRASETMRVEHVFDY